MQGSGESIQELHRRVFCFSLNAAEVGAVYPRIGRKPFLRETSGHPQRSQIPGKTFARIHVRI